MVYLSNETAKARTNGARLVIRTVWERTFSPTSVVGSARDASMSVGFRGSKTDDDLTRLGDCVDELSIEDLFLHTLLAAVRTCLATLSSVKMEDIVLRSLFAI